MQSQTKLRVALIFGGRSAEHEVSLQSARNILAAMDKNRFEPVLIGIDREGRWFLNDESLNLLNADRADVIALDTNQTQVSLVANGPEQQLINLDSGHRLGKIDVLFPILHGPYGEDGAIQGLARLANLPCVGADILGSSIGMDKDIMKRLLRDASIPTADFVTLYHWQTDIDYPAIADQLGFPAFVKPANMGSSVGVSKVRSVEELLQAVKMAFEYDQKVIIEKNINGRELEVSILGNDQLQASDVGEVLPQTDFYSYESKYLDAEGAKLEMPADLTGEQRSAIQQIGMTVFRLLDCSGMARVDVFMTDDNTIWVNEINTLPGFTNISMYPKLWELSGVKQTDLISRLIDLAVERYQQRSQLRCTR